MKTVRKEWLGFFLCLSLTCALTVAILWNARTEFRRQVIQSELFLLKAEIKRMTEELEVTFMERDLTFLDLGMPDLVHNREELLEQFALEAISIPRISQLFLYDSNGQAIQLPTDTLQSMVNQEMIDQAKETGMTYSHQPGQPFVLFFESEWIEGPYFLEVQMDPTSVLREWKAIDTQLLQQGILIILSGGVLLYMIFRFLSQRIQEREQALEAKGELLQKTNRKLAQSYKSASLGALTGHLMHSLKSPLTNLQSIVGQENQDINPPKPNELRMIHSQIQELVSQSLLALQEIEEQKKSYELSIGEIFHIAIKRVRSPLKKEEVVIEESSSLSTKLDNLQSSLVLPILVSILENSLQAKEDASVRLRSEKDHQKVRILISDDAGGIPPSERNTLFSPKRSNKKHGTGLGLALAMQLAESMEATLELLNSDEKGSTFCLSMNLPT